MKKTNKTFRGMPIYSDPEAPPGSVFVLNGSLKNLPPRRNGQLTDVDEDSEIDVDNVGFKNIYYKGKPVERDLTPKTEYFVVAKNRIHRWWLTKVRKYPADKVIYVKDFKGNFDFIVDLEKSVPAQGRVVKAKSRPEYDPTPRTGGRVTKAMPKQLRKIKEGQENGQS